MSNRSVIESLRGALACDADGKLYWKINKGGVKIGQEAGKINSDGYKSIGFMRKTYLAHRIVWALSYGDWPTQSIDHIDGNKTNNALSNLRLANHSQNQANRFATSSTGFKGVSKLPNGRFQAQAGGNVGKKYLGTFNTAEEAAQAYNIAAQAKFGQYARLNVLPDGFHQTKLDEAAP
ncbi:MAG TPA: AP2/ERF family transcription factor [Aquabacterium sp.]|nr:AP2/ERF family transcription factor [Aquabacterium sp.]